MGTQQILLIVLSVIIVGVAAGVGITMFNNQAVSSNRQQIMSDLQNFGAQSLGYFKTPNNLGGGQNDFTSADNSLERWLGFDATADTIATVSGDFSITTQNATTLIIEGLGTETGTDGTTPVKATLTITPADANPLAMSINN